jgi:hypothetical protein
MSDSWPLEIPFLRGTPRRLKSLPLITSYPLVYINEEYWSVDALLPLNKSIYKNVLSCVDLHLVYFFFVRFKD